MRRLHERRGFPFVFLFSFSRLKGGRCLSLLPLFLIYLIFV